MICKKAKKIMDEEAKRFKEEEDKRKEELKESWCARDYGICPRCGEKLLREKIKEYDTYYRDLFSFFLKLGIVNVYKLSCKKCNFKTIDKLIDERLMKFKDYFRRSFWKIKK